MNIKLWVISTESVSKLALGHFVGSNRRKALISACAGDLNEGENISARCYFKKQHAVVHLSISLVFSLLVFKCDPRPNYLRIVVLFSPHLQMLSLDTSVKWK